MENYLQKTILLVEDDAIIGMVTKENLEKLKYDVIVAGSGEKAVATVKENSSIDVILMDIDLGTGLNGIQTAELVFAEREIPVVFVSSHNEREVISMTEKITSYGYIVKSSSYIVYDTSIKMALRLFNEKTKAQEVNAILNYSLDQVNEAIFISNMKGDVIYCNDKFARIMRKVSKKECLKNIADYTVSIDIFNSKGKFLQTDQWVSSRGLRGERGDDEIYYISSKSADSIVAKSFSYSPIKDREGEVVGSFVSIDNKPPVAEKGIVDIIKEFKAANYS
ncbi:MAG: response regulator [Spirochaetes bacterium]|nr:response regulator [Spirochaetota bacterium]